MLVVVFKNGVSHEIKQCTKVTAPTYSTRGSIENFKGTIGTVFSTDDIAFWYFTEDPPK